MFNRLKLSILTETGIRGYKQFKQVFNTILLIASIFRVFLQTLFRLFAMWLERYSRMSDEKVYEKFIANSGNVKIKENRITIEMKKKRGLPLLLETMTRYKEYKYEWLNNITFAFMGAASS